jgi:hypothetical protein
VSSTARRGAVACPFCDSDQPSIQHDVEAAAEHGDVFLGVCECGTEGPGRRVPTRSLTQRSTLIQRSPGHDRAFSFGKKNRPKGRFSRL